MMKKFKASIIRRRRIRLKLSRQLTDSLIPTLLPKLLMLSKFYPQLNSSNSKKQSMSLKTNFSIIWPIQTKELKRPSLPIIELMKEMCQKRLRLVKAKKLSTLNNSQV